MTIRILSFVLFGWLVLALPQLVSAQPAAMPAFKMMRTNGTFYQAADLPKGKPVVLIYFAPDCDHCQVLLQAFFKRIEAFKKAEVVLVTFKPVRELLPFERAYGTAKYPNVQVGTEGTTYFLRMFYKLQTTPFTALYDKNGKLAHAYRKEPPVDELIERLNSLK